MEGASLARPKPGQSILWTNQKKLRTGSRPTQLRRSDIYFVMSVSRNRTILDAAPNGADTGVGVAVAIKIPLLTELISSAFLD